MKPKPPKTKSRTGLLVERVRGIVPAKPDTIRCRFCLYEHEKDRERCPNCGVPVSLRAAM